MISVIPPLAGLFAPAFPSLSDYDDDDEDDGDEHAMTSTPAMRNGVTSGPVKPSDEETPPDSSHHAVAADGKRSPGKEASVDKSTDERKSQPPSEDLELVVDTLFINSARKDSTASVNEGVADEGEVDKAAVGNAKTDVTSAADKKLDDVRSVGTTTGADD